MAAERAAPAPALLASDAFSNCADLLSYSDTFLPITNSWFCDAASCFSSFSWSLCIASYMSPNACMSNSFSTNSFLSCFLSL